MDKIRDLIITGVPRSGTTLVAALVDGLQESLCLSEPDWEHEALLEITDRSAYVAQIGRDFDMVRETILAGGSVTDRRSRDGSPVTNYFRLQKVNLLNRFRFQLTEWGFRKVPVSRLHLSPDFMLGIKQNEPFAAVLPELTAEPRFRVLAVVRHPVPTLLSWRAINIIPMLNRRILPDLQTFWPEALEIQVGPTDVLEKQARILNLLLDRFLQYRDRLMLVRYEDLISNQELICSLLGRPLMRPVAVKNSNRNPVYNLDELAQIKDYIRRYAPAARALSPDLEAY